MNASDERGISIVREKIKNFARQTPRAQAASSDGMVYPCPPYKIIILDEADSMTQDAQGALRRIMETYARITRFCLVCNYVTRSVLLDYTRSAANNGSRIIEPVASRCSKFRFTPLDSGSARSRLSYIATAENVNVTDEVIDALVSASSGDLRRAITYLQSASRLSSSTSPPTPITPTNIQEIAGVVPDAVVSELASALGIDDVGQINVDMDIAQKSSTFEPIRKKVKQIMRQGYSAAQMLSQVRGEALRSLRSLNLCQLHDLVVLHPTLNGRQKSQAALVIAEADKSCTQNIQSGVIVRKLYFLPATIQRFAPHTLRSQLMSSVIIKI